MQTTRDAGIEGHRVRQQRLAQGMTQADLAARSGLSQEAISRIENGKIKGLLQSTQGALATALGTTAEYLRGDTESSELPALALGALSRETVVERDEDDPLVVALGRAFDYTRHLVVDTHAVLETLRATDRRLVEGLDLDVAARAWLDAAAALRREGIPVTTQNVLVRVTAGRSPRAQSAVDAREAAATAEAGARARALGVEPGSATSALPRRAR